MDEEHAVFVARLGSSARSGTVVGRLYHYLPGSMEIKDVADSIGEDACISTSSSVRLWILPVTRLDE
jgi:hypothetical protein